MNIKLLMLFFICFLYKFLTSISDLYNIYKYKKSYSAFLSNKNCRIFEYRTPCINLFKKLKISDAKIPISQKTGYGQIANFTTSLFENFPDKTNVFASETIRFFYDAIGIIKYNIKQCFNPFYWINLVLFLPKNILLYLNVSTESIFMKITQLIYWLLGVLLTLFSSDIAEYLKTLIHI